MSADRRSSRHEELLDAQGAYFWLHLAQFTRATAEVEG